ncbi:MAG: Ribosomal protein L11 methyltransferase [Verrucomicrobia bacterium ADurb.Bin474]|nr:MAG: Ribosomal protein L11 methyltransferase [Verrucomicrobia bacterium ADurb.Bin474]
MIELRLNIDDTLADALESWFCEEIQQSWILYRKNPREACELRGYFDDKEHAASALASLSIHFPALSNREWAESTLEDQDWKMAYRHHLKPWAVGHLHWVPEWERDAFIREDGHLYLYLDSGMAFGTGSHETTRLCAEALYRHYVKNGGPAGQGVIDAGCGSGILAMSAFLLGYAPVYAFDRDPEAVRVTSENVGLNGMNGLVEVRQAGLEDGLSKRKAPVIMANIQADVLGIYAEEIVRAWDPEGGLLILSGILHGEEHKILEVFGGLLAMVHEGKHFSGSVQVMGEWVSVCFERKS